MGGKKHWHMIVKEGEEEAYQAGTFPTKHAVLLRVSEDYGPDPDGGRIWPSGVEDFFFAEDGIHVDTRVFIVPMYQPLPDPPGLSRLSQISQVFRGGENEA